MGNVSVALEVPRNVWCLPLEVAVFEWHYSCISYRQKLRRHRHLIQNRKVNLKAGWSANDFSFLFLLVYVPMHIYMICSPE